MVPLAVYKHAQLGDPRGRARTVALHAGAYLVLAFKMLFSPILLGLVGLMLTSGVAAADQTMRIATYNLRYDSMPDNISVQQSLTSLPDPLQAPVYYGKTGEQPWSTRRIKVFEHLESAGVVLAGTCLSSW